MPVKPRPSAAVVPDPTKGSSATPPSGTRELDHARCRLLWKLRLVPVVAAVPTGFLHTPSILHSARSRDSKRRS